MGSASIKCMYRRYTGHLLRGKGGSILVKRAVEKYGLENFDFVVIETTDLIRDKQTIFKIEQKYIDLLKPQYNIAKIAGSLLNIKWSLESKLRFKNSNKLKIHLETLRLNRKPVTEEKRALLRSIALKRAPFSPPA